MSKTAAVLHDKRGGLTILRLNQPDRMNALSGDIKEALGEYVPDFMADPAARCLLISGTEKAFCAGGDIRNMVGEQPPMAVRERLAISHEKWARHLITGEKPVIMAINGAAVGAGFALSMLGDIIIAADSAYFLAGFSTVGAAADLGLGITLPRAVGMPRAKQILFTNARVSASEALVMGMVNRVTDFDQLMPAAIELGEKLASGPTVGIGLTKTLLNKGYEESMSSFFQTEAVVQAVAFSSKDRAEGAAAFLEKRKPNFVGQ